MVLAAQGAVTLHTTKYPLEDFQRALDDLDDGAIGAGRSSSPDRRRHHAPAPPTDHRCT